MGVVNLRKYGESERRDGTRPEVKGWKASRTYTMFQPYFCSQSSSTSLMDEIAQQGWYQLMMAVTRVGTKATNTEFSKKNSDNKEATSKL